MFDETGKKEINMKNYFTNSSNMKVRMWRTVIAVTLRYYEDMPHVAYIGVSDFELLRSPNRSVRVNKTAASQYQLTTNK